MSDVTGVGYTGTTNSAPTEVPTKVETQDASIFTGGTTEAKPTGTDYDIGTYGDVFGEEQDSYGSDGDQKPEQPTVNNQKPYTSTVILTGSSIEATNPTPWGQALINLRQEDKYTLNNLIEAVYPNASKSERADLARRFKQENAEALVGIDTQGDIKESLNDKLSDLRYPKLNSLDYNKTSENLTQEVEFSTDEEYTFQAGNYKGDPRNAIAQDILDHYKITESDFSSAAGQAVMKAIIENPNNAQLFSSSGARDLSTLDGFLGALAENYMKNGELSLTTPNVVVSFLNNGEQEYSQKELRDLATESSNYVSSQLSPTTTIPATFTNASTYMDILNCIEYSTDENGKPITLKQAIENASDEEKASMIALGESALLQLAQNNDSLKGLIDKNGQLIKNDDGTSILSAHLNGNGSTKVDFKPVNYMLRQGAAPQMVETPTPKTAKPANTTTKTEEPIPSETEPIPSETEPIPSETEPIPSETCPDLPVVDPDEKQEGETPSQIPSNGIDTDDSGADFKDNNPSCKDNEEVSTENPDKSPTINETEKPKENEETTGNESGKNNCGDVGTVSPDYSDVSIESSVAASAQTTVNTAETASSAQSTTSESSSSGTAPTGNSSSTGGDNGGSSGGSDNSSSGGDSSSSSGGSSGGDSSGDDHKKEND